MLLSVEKEFSHDVVYVAEVRVSLNALTTVECTEDVDGIIHFPFSGGTRVSNFLYQKLLSQINHISSN